MDDPGSRKRTACALRSVKSSLEIVVSYHHLPFEHSEPKSVSMPQTSSKIKMLRACLVRELGLTVTRLKTQPKKKSGHLTMDRSNMKRQSWHATQATVSELDDCSDEIVALSHIHGHIFVACSD